MMAITTRSSTSVKPERRFMTDSPLRSVVCGEDGNLRGMEEKKPHARMTGEVSPFLLEGHQAESEQA
jgi:hypothetical protein